MEVIYFNYLMERSLSRHIKIQVSADLNRSNIIQKKGTILDSTTYKGIGKNVYSSFGVALQYDTRDDILYTSEGLYVKFSADYIPGMFDNKKAYSKAYADSRFYLTPGNMPFTLAGRIYAEKVQGDYYLFDAATLGGSENLLGFARERFSGDAGLMSIAELRAPVQKLRIIIPGILGISLHTGTGRVFFNDRAGESDKWHGFWGGGLWVSYLQNSLMINVIVSHSVEGTPFYLNTGFMF